MKTTLRLNTAHRRLFLICKTIPWTYAGLVAGLFPKDTETVLDLGCGNGSFMEIINSSKKYEATGVEIFDKYVQEAQKSGIYKKVYKADMTKFRTASKYDVVFLAHAIEHLPKEKGVMFLNGLRKLAKRRIIIITPNGEFHQEKYDDNPYQKHQSSWKVEDFRKRGYRVIGQGWRVLYKNRFIKYYGTLFYLFFVFSTLTQPLLRIFPQLGLQMICYKDV